MNHPQARFSFSHICVLVFLTLGLIASTSCTGIPLTSTSASSSSSSTIAASSQVQQVLDLTNAQRTLAGLNPVTLSDQLNQAALAHTQDMVSNKFFSHYGSDGSDPGLRINRTGYQWSAYGENIAQGYTTAQDVVNGWMNSPDHRANILNPVFTQMGAAVVDTTWTQDFATPR